MLQVQSANQLINAKPISYHQQQQQQQQQQQPQPTFPPFHRATVSRINAHLDAFEQQLPTEGRLAERSAVTRVWLLGGELSVGKGLQGPSQVVQCEIYVARKKNEFVISKVEKQFKMED